MSGSRPTILVADDNSTIQKAAAQILGQAGMEVVTVANGMTAILKLPKVKPLVVLADADMPGKDGYEVSRFIKTAPEFRHVRVLLAVNDEFPYDKERGRKSQVDGVLKKPFQHTELVSAVSLCVDQALAAAPRETAPSISQEPEVLSCDAIPDLSVSDSALTFDAGALPTASGEAAVPGAAHQPELTFQSEPPEAASPEPAATNVSEAPAEPPTETPAAEAAPEPELASQAEIPETASPQLLLTAVSEAPAEPPTETSATEAAREPEPASQAEIPETVSPEPVLTAVAEAAAEPPTETPVAEAAPETEPASQAETAETVSTEPVVHTAADVPPEASGKPAAADEGQLVMMTPLDPNGNGILPDVGIEILDLDQLGSYSIGPDLAPTTSSFRLGVDNLDDVETLELALAESDWSDDPFSERHRAGAARQAGEATSLDLSLVAAVVQKVVWKLAPPALPRDMIVELEQKLTREIVTELTSEASPS